VKPVAHIGDNNRVRTVLAILGGFLSHAGIDLKPIEKTEEDYRRESRKAERNQPRNNHPSLVRPDDPDRKISRQQIRHELRLRARKEFNQTYGFISHSGNIHFAAEELYKFPRRARRLIIRRTAARWYRSMRSQLDGKVAVPANAYEAFKQKYLPGWFKQKQPVKHKLEAAAGSQ
jgi:hypothetical protein